MQITGWDPAGLQGSLRRFHRHIGRGHFRRRNVPLTNASAVHDPLIGRFDHFFEI